MTRFVGIRAPGARARKTSAQTAAAFRSSYEARNPKRVRPRPFCCARFEWSDQTHDLSCSLTDRRQGSH